MLVYMDTGALTALNDRSDGNHAAAVSYFRKSARGADRFVPGRPVVVEYLDGVTKRIGKTDAVLRMRQMESSSLWRVEPDTDEDHVRARELFSLFDDHPIDMTDSLSFAIMERLHLREVFSFDSGFAAHGFTVLPGAPK